MRQKPPEFVRKFRPYGRAEIVASQELGRYFYLFAARRLSSAEAAEAGGRAYQNALCELANADYWVEMYGLPSLPSDQAFWADHLHSEGWQRNKPLTNRMIALAVVDALRRRRGSETPLKPEQEAEAQDGWVLRQMEAERAYRSLTKPEQAVLWACCDGYDFGAWFDSASFPFSEWRLHEEDRDKGWPKRMAMWGGSVAPNQAPGYKYVLKKLAAEMAKGER